MSVDAEYVGNHPDIQRLLADPEYARRALEYSNSYTCGLILVPVLWHRPSDWQLLAEHWSRIDNVHTHRVHFDKLFREYRRDHGFPIREVMAYAGNVGAQAVYAALPDVVTVYRGCYEHNLQGLSWTLNRAIAERFPFQNRYKHPGLQPLLVTGRVKKSQIAFIECGREEAEVVAPYRSVRRVSVESITSDEERAP